MSSGRSWDGGAGTSGGFDGRHIASDIGGPRQCVREWRLKQDQPKEKVNEHLFEVSNNSFLVHEIGDQKQMQVDPMTE
jgi:hypothetical protein